MPVLSFSSDINESFLIKTIGKIEENIINNSPENTDYYKNILRKQFIVFKNSLPSTISAEKMRQLNYLYNVFEQNLMSYESENVIMSNIEEFNILLLQISYEKLNSPIDTIEFITSELAKVDSLIDLEEFEAAESMLTKLINIVSSIKYSIPNNFLDIDNLLNKLKNLSFTLVIDKNIPQKLHRNLIDILNNFHNDLDEKNSYDTDILKISFIYEKIQTLSLLITKKKSNNFDILKNDLFSYCVNLVMKNPDAAKIIIQITDSLKSAKTMADISKIRSMLIESEKIATEEIITKSQILPDILYKTVTSNNKNYWDLFENNLNILKEILDTYKIKDKNTLSAISSLLKTNENLLDNIKKTSSENNNQINAIVENIYENTL